jgi:hypothetical protein
MKKKYWTMKRSFDLQVIVNYIASKYDFQWQTGKIRSRSKTKTKTKNQKPKEEEDEEEVNLSLHT